MCFGGKADSRNAFQLKCCCNVSPIALQKLLSKRCDLTMGLEAKILSSSPGFLWS